MKNSISRRSFLKAVGALSAAGALAQIKEKRYGSALQDYTGNLLLVGINYDKTAKKHECLIEKVEKR